MTGQELYELSAKGYKHDPWEKLQPALRKYYEQVASTRRGDNYQEQGQSLLFGESACCGGCSGSCDE